VWRDTPDCATNHDLSYMKSPDMVNWYNALEQPIDLPITVDNKSVVVDPIPAQGGIINLAAKLCLDETNKPIFAYHKYDSAGNLQFYTARLISEAWQIKQVTDWNYRWYFSGHGSINKEVFIGPFNRRDDGYYELGYNHIKYGTGTLLLNENLDLCGEVLKPQPFAATVAVEGEFPGLKVRTAEDQGKGTDEQVQYVLKWETLPRNRDKPRPKPWPEPSQLYLYELHNIPDN
ncbi:MAG: BNR-4 repeat-containing protein, partial [Bacteroidota bacterium]